MRAARPGPRGLARGRDERQGSVAAAALRTVPLAGETTASLNSRVAARYGLQAARFIWFTCGRNNSSASEVLTSTTLPDKPDLLLPVLEYGLLQKTTANRVVRTPCPQSSPCPASSRAPLLSGRTGSSSVNVVGTPCVRERRPPRKTARSRAKARPMPAPGPPPE